MERYFPNFSISFCSASDKVTLELPASSSVAEKDDVMQLVYRNFYERDPKTKEFKITAKLVYIPKD